MTPPITIEFQRQVHEDRTTLLQSSMHRPPSFRPRRTLGLSASFRRKAEIDRSPLQLRRLHQVVLRRAVAEEKHDARIRGRGGVQHFFE